MAMNPYLSDQASAITSAANQNLNLGIMPGINHNATMAGGYGGSRHGVAQGIAAGMTQQGITNSLANLYGGAYQADQSLQTQRDISAQQNATAQRGQDYNYNLGLGGLGLGLTNSNQGFYTNNRQLDLAQMGLGANLASQGNNGLSGQGTDLYNTGATANQAGWGALNNLGGSISPFMQNTGTVLTNGTQTQNGAALNPWAGAAGGAITGAQLWNLFNQKPGG